STHLHLNLRVFDQIEIPCRVMFVSAARRDDYNILAVLAVDQGGAPPLAGFAPACGQQQSRHTAPLVSAAALGLDIAVNMFANPTCRAVVNFVLIGHDCSL